MVKTCQTLILKSLFQGLDRPPLFPGFDEVIDNLGNYFDIILDNCFFLKTWAGEAVGASGLVKHTPVTVRSSAWKKVKVK